MRLPVDRPPNTGGQTLTSSCSHQEVSQVRNFSSTLAVFPMHSSSGLSRALSGKISSGKHNGVLFFLCRKKVRSPAPVQTASKMQ